MLLSAAGGQLAVIAGGTAPKSRERMARHKELAR
jgi:hypothetical protein